MNVAITIAGSDSGGGAGIQADIKTFEAHGIFGTTAITGITAQNTVGVRSVFVLPASIVVEQLEAVFDDMPVAVVKIGMLSSQQTIESVARFLRTRAAAIPIVLDPVMVATSGDLLLPPDAIDALISRLLPLATVVTPNTHEATVISGISITDDASAILSGERIIEQGGNSVLIKGGDRTDTGNNVVDLLIDRDGLQHRFSSKRIPGRNTHGTGCTLSSSIAAHLSLGKDLSQAIEAARHYVSGAILHAPNLGTSHGPLLHGRGGTGGRHCS